METSDNFKQIYFNMVCSPTVKYSFVQLPSDSF